MLHLSLLHLGINCWALLPLLSAFELQNGTVRTGIVLNALGTVTGVLYILCSFVFFPSGSVLGSSAWVFSFLAYFSYLESKYSPSTTLYDFLFENIFIYMFFFFFSQTNLSLFSSFLVLLMSEFPLFLNQLFY